MVERIEAGFDIAMIVLVVLLGMLTVGIGMTLSWFIFQPFKWLQWMVRHG